MKATNLPVVLTSKDDSLVRAMRDATDRVEGLRLVAVEGADEALRLADREPIGVILVHQAAGEDTSEATRLIRELASRGKAVATVVVADEHRAKDELMLLRLGAADFLSRPIDLNRIVYLLDVLTVRARYAVAPTTAAPADAPDLVLEQQDGPPFLYLSGTTMGRLMEQVHRVASQEATVLLGGETGTGKTRLARLIHDRSGRRDEPFLVVNCGALSATLIESEMFGHIRGAFTGADRDKVGKFEEVGGGTLLLDEIDSLPVALQAKLLRAVEERVFEPVGSNRPVPMRARLVVASNRDLSQEVTAGRFRADLFYRLNVVSFTLPPLRERGGLVHHLARLLVAEFSARSGRPALEIAPEAMRALAAHAWPGNIRELRNVIERAVVLSQGPTIGLGDLPDSFHAAPPPEAAIAPKADSPAAPARTTLSETREMAELERIVIALKKHANNRLRAAAELGVSRMTLYKKLHKYGLMTA